MALREYEPVAFGPRRVRRIDVQDPFVEHEERVQGRGAALVVLLVAGGQSHEPANLFHTASAAHQLSSSG